MDLNSLDLAGLGFWLAAGMAASAWIWSNVKKQQMRHELTLKLLERGQGLDQELLAKLLASEKPAGPQKSPAEKRRDDSGVGGFIFLIAGVMLAGIGILGGSELVPVDTGIQGPGGVPLAPMMTFQDTGPNWLLVGLGVLCFLYGNWVFHSARKEYERDKAEEKLSGK